MKRIIEQLESAYNQLNELKFGNSLLPCVITIQANPSKKEELYGWCTNEPLWIDIQDNSKGMYEINIVAESLNRPYEEIIKTLLHEMVHLSNSFKGIEDCTKRGKHLESFKTEAERVGFIVEEMDKKGFAHTMLSDSLKVEINQLYINKEVFNIYRYNKPKQKKDRKPRETYKYVCSTCGKEVKSKHSGLIINCGICEVQFEEVKKDNEV